MPKKTHQVIHIALVGGGELCKDIIERTSYVFKQQGIDAPIVAVSDPNPNAPGVVLAKKLALNTFMDHRELYDTRHGIDLIIILSPEQELFRDILATRPPHIRLMSYHVFRIFWKAIVLEEEKLRERNKEIELILNGIQDLISVITPDMTIVDVNEGFLRHMKCSREEVIGRKCHEIFQTRSEPCDEKERLCPLKEIIHNKRASRRVMTRDIRGKDTQYFEVSVYPIWEKDGRISKFIEISRDITEHKKEEEAITRRLEKMVEERTWELKETHNKLLHQDKMASLGKLAASVVHEINNPVAGLLNMTLLMKRIMEEGPVNTMEMDRFKEYLNLMGAETRRISKIVSNLLAFSRQSKMEMKGLDLNRLIDKTLVINSNLLKINSVYVEKRLAPDLPPIMGSEDQVQQVFMNLISNAAESMEANGKGTLIVETGYSAKDGMIFVSFRDTGAGIFPENLPRLFEPFFTTKKKGKGVGLGLSVAYGIVQEHNGLIDVQSAPGQGSIFTVRFPMKKS